MARFYNLCERRFQLGQNKTSIRTEILAGVTTFATMSYVLATVPNMLSNAGLPKGAVLTVLIIMISVCSIAMALYTNRPFCLAPGMSSVAIVSSIFGEAGIPVEVAFGLIFLSGVLFVIISFVGLRELVVKAIPASVKFSISAGIGLFIALMGLKTGDVVVAGNSNSLAFGNLKFSESIFVRTRLCCTDTIRGTEIPRKHDCFHSRGNLTWYSAWNHHCAGNYDQFSCVRNGDCL